jgi:hypothetical protein
VDPLLNTTATITDAGETKIILIPTGYSISQFKDYKISDVTNYPEMRTDIPPPSEITII